MGKNRKTWNWPIDCKNIYVLIFLYYSLHSFSYCGFSVGIFKCTWFLCSRKYLRSSEVYLSYKCWLASLWHNLRNTEKFLCKFHLFYIQLRSMTQGQFHVKNRYITKSKISSRFSQKQNLFLKPHSFHFFKYFIWFVFATFYLKIKFCHKRKLWYLQMIKSFTILKFFD